MFRVQSDSKRLRSFPVLAVTLVFSSASAFAQAPNVVADVQQVVGSGYNNPQSIAISSNGTIYVADTGNGQIQILRNQLPNPGANTPLQLPSNITPALSTPQGLAVDANGDLFIGDSPAGGGRIVELTGDGNGGLTGAGQVVYAGATLTDPIALAVDSAGTLYIGDWNNTNPSSPVGTIFTIVAGGNAPTVLNTGLPASLIPAGLAVDAAKDLYIVDNNLGGVYKVRPGGTATPVPVGQFVFNGPSGVTLDAAGDLFILTQIGTGADGQVVEIPAASPNTPYILPSTSLGNTTGFAFDPQGNIDIVGLVSGSVVQLAYRNAVNMGSGTVGVAPTATPVLFNFGFNIPRTLQGFKVVTQGDTSNELTQTGGTCVLGRHTTVNGAPITNYVPYICNESYTASPAFPGLRSVAVQAEGTGTTILASVPAYENGYAGAQVIYPLTATVTAKGLKQPQALAFSGLDKTLYIADTVASGSGAQGVVYSTRGASGTALTPVSTGRVPLVAPSALAVDGAGNLFIADFERGDVVKVPPAPTGQAASLINTGGLLQHPISLALDLFGDLFIGDAGSGGVNATSGNPGFIVEVPLAGSPFKISIPSVQVVFPQALAVDPVSFSLFIGDGGDPSSTGQVVQLSADLTTANVFPVANVTNPTGLGFDPADDLYVLDGNANTITVVAAGQAGNAGYLLPFDNSTLSAASALAMSAGGQSLVVANIGSGSNNNLVFLNGNISTLNFGNVTVGQSANATATITNIGTIDLDLSVPPLSVVNPNPAFSFLGSSTCYGGLTLDIAGSCTMAMQFTPTTNGLTSLTLNILTDGYNSGTTFIAEGTGVGGSNARHNHKPQK
jgi:sugar lactone lactonase YvrE